MSIKIMAEVWDCTSIKGGKKLFLLALADQAGDEDRCAWPGVAQLQRRTGVGRSTLYEYADELLELNFLERVAEEDRPLRYRSRPGRETTCWRIRPVEDWTRPETGPVRDLDATSPEAGPQGSGWPDKNRQGTIKRTTMKERRRAMHDDEGEPVFGQLDAEPEPEPTVEELHASREKPARPLSTVMLLQRWREYGLLAYPMDSRRYTAERGHLGKNITAWRRQGIPSDVIEAAMARFMADKRFHAPGVPLWQSFVNSWVDLADRAARTTRSKDTEEEQDMETVVWA